MRRLSLFFGNKSRSLVRLGGNVRGGGMRLFINAAESGEKLYGIEF